MKKLIVAAASVLAIGVGEAPMSHAGDVGKSAPDLNWTAPASGAFQYFPPAATASRDDITQVQLELRYAGFYNGPIDGVIGPQTKQALVQFQKESGLKPTASLDANTMVAMFGNIGPSQGPGVPLTADQGSGQ